MFLGIMVIMGILVIMQRYIIAITFKECYYNIIKTHGGNYGFFKRVFGLHTGAAQPA